MIARGFSSSRPSTAADLECTAASDFYHHRNTYRLHYSSFLWFIFKIRVLRQSQKGTTVEPRNKHLASTSVRSHSGNYYIAASQVFARVFHFSKRRSVQLPLLPLIEVKNDNDSSSNHDSIAIKITVTAIIVLIIIVMMIIVITVIVNASSNIDRNTNNDTLGMSKRKISPGD